MIKIAICDDEPRIRSEIESMTNNVAKSLNIKIDTDVFKSGNELCEYIKDGERFDIIYVDIEMSDMNGVEAGKWIRESRLDDTTLLIYVSSHDKYHGELFDVQPYNFIKKPINQDDFKRIFIKACNKINRSKDFFSFSFNRKNVKLDWGDIVYFESVGRLINVHTVNQVYQYYDKLSSIIEKNNRGNFIQIHKSYILNLDYVKEIDSSKVIISTGEKFKISETFQKSVNRQYLSYIKERM